LPRDRDGVLFPHISRALHRRSSPRWGMGLGLGGTFVYFHAKSISDLIIQLKDAALTIGHGELDIKIALQREPLGAP
jgi:hypothetical protein